MNSSRMNDNACLDSKQKVRENELALSLLEEQYVKLQDLIGDLLYAVEPVFLERSEAKLSTPPQEDIPRSLFIRRVRELAMNFEGSLNRLESVIRGISV